MDIPKVDLRGVEPGVPGWEEARAAVTYGFHGSLRLRRCRVRRSRTGAPGGAVRPCLSGALSASAGDQEAERIHQVVQKLHSKSRNGL